MQIDMGAPGSRTWVRQGAETGGQLDPGQRAGYTSPIIEPSAHLK